MIIFLDERNEGEFWCENLVNVRDRLAFDARSNFTEVVIESKFKSE